MTEKLYSVDINCDLGEGMPCDADIMPYISSCSIACGGHAGNEDSMRQTLALAKQYQVKVGAHPSYPDKENFGRKSLNLSKDALKESLVAQIKSLKSLINEFDLSLHHIKPHGALYNDAARDAELAEHIIEIFKSLLPNVKLYAPFGSELAKAATNQGIEVVYEVFADRNYNDDLSLVSRTRDNALIHDVEESYLHIKRMLLDGQVKTIQNNLKPIQANTICVHSDTQEAVAIVAKLHQALLDDGFHIQ